MGASGRRRAVLRTTRLEQLEPRLLMSGDPVGDFFIDYLVETQQFSEVETSLADADQWTGLEEIRETYGFTGAGQTVAIIDSGIAYTHEALGGGLGTSYRVVGGYDFAEQDADPYDDGPFGSHGTHVAGIVGSSDTDSLGLAPEVDLVALRVFNDQGVGSFTWVEQALDWVHENLNAFENPITTVSLSLGASWNSESIPSWAMLEDELAQLEADGVFIAVAAGNSFATYNAAGLSYPAASSYVVPVSSVDSSGLLSSYSQRSDRAIAAPGQKVLSTVPDYAGDYNGVDDDLAAYSGTSMAAPYVAGASVILREAYAFVGVDHVTQDMLYELMRSTADTIYDSVTGSSYYRLNLEQALDAIMPKDDFSVTDWGTVAQAKFADQRIDAAGQWFAVTAANDGILTIEALLTSGQSNVVLQVCDGSHTPIAGAVVSADGQRVDLRVSAGDTVLVNVAVGSQGQAQQVDFRVTNLVAQNGTTVRVLGTDGEDSFAFAAGLVHRVTINGVTYAFDASQVRSVQFDGRAGADTAVLTGSAGADTAVLQVGSAQMSGSGYQVTTTQTETHVVRGGGGSDTAKLYDSSGGDTFTARPDSARMTGAGFDNRADGFRYVRAYSRSGKDTAHLYDSAGNDTLIATPTYSRLYSSTFEVRADRFRYVNAYASAGGNDVANLYDSAGNDTFVGSSAYAKLYGTTFCNTAKLFDVVHAYTKAGGVDQAALYDSGGNDTLKAGGATAKLVSQAAAIQVYGFERVRAYASRGGKDTSEVRAVDYVLQLLGKWNA